MAAAGNARTALTAVLALCALGVGDAHAAPGDHVQVGRAELIPTLELGTEWRSNLYLEDNADNTVSGAALLVYPGLSIGLDTNEAKFDLSATYGLKKYYITSKSGNPSYTPRNIDRYNDLDTGLSLHVLPKGIVGVKLGEDFSIDNRETEALWADNTALITHIRSHTTGGLAVHPGSAFEVDLGGHVTFDGYTGNPDATTAGSNGRLNNRLAYGPDIGVDWSFFPRTALLVDFSMNWFTWDSNTINAVGGLGVLEDPGDVIIVPNGRDWRVTGGVQGRISHTVVVNALVGYGQVSYTEASGGSADDTLKGTAGLLGVAKATWTPVNGQSISLGYQKDFQDSWFTNNVGYHYGFGRYTGLLASRWGLMAEGGVRYESYRGQVTRNDMVIRANGSLTYNAAEWMDLGLSGGWNRRVSADNPPVPTIEYDDYPISFTVTLTY
jgi:hypothetical protein